MGGRLGMGWGFDIFQKFAVRFPARGKSFQSNATKFPHPGLHIAVKYPKAGPKNGTIKISPSKLGNLYLYYVAASPKIHVSVTAAIIRFNHNPCYTA